MTRFTVDHHLAKPEHFVFKRIDSSSRFVFIFIIISFTFYMFWVWNRIQWLAFYHYSLLCLYSFHLYIYQTEIFKNLSLSEISHWTKQTKLNQKNEKIKKKCRNFSLCMRSIKRPMNNFEWVKKCCSLLSVELIFSWFHCAFDVTIPRIRPTIPAL